MGKNYPKNLLIIFYFIDFGQVSKNYDKFFEGTHYNDTSAVTKKQNIFFRLPETLMEQKSHLNQKLVG